MTTAVLSIGSNLGDPYQRLLSTVEGLGEAVVGVSAVYETQPWGPVEQPAFLNAVVIVSDDDTSVEGWLDVAREQEAAAGRVRAERWGPRTLDVDVIAVRDAKGEVTSDSPELTLPHPRAHERAFVLVPWAEVEPGAALAGHGRVADLLANLDPADRAGVHRRGDLPLVRS
jgi:2-amino-4-hydroxy-6-hydroxymethyldihydropteridine diphosphokinase